jgi:Zn-dependent M28 family amino/carboxypeptidase
MGHLYTNVIGTMGTDGAERVVVGAHYDVCGEQPGADDNASAVAGLLEVSRLLNPFASTLKYRVDFVAYTLEEPPFFGTPEMGSYVHAQSLHEDGVKVRGMISLEMIGYFTDEEDSQDYPLPLMKLFYPSKGDFIGVVGNFRSRALVKEVKGHMSAAPINVESLSAPAIVPGVNFSDHRSYWEFGYPAVMVTDTAFFRNPHYHRVSDVAETLDFDTMKEVVKGVAWTVLNLSRG